MLCSGWSQQTAYLIHKPTLGSSCYPQAAILMLISKSQFNVVLRLVPTDSLPHPQTHLGVQLLPTDSYCNSNKPITTPPLWSGCTQLTANLIFRPILGSGCPKLTANLIPRPILGLVYVFVLVGSCIYRSVPYIVVRYLLGFA